MPNFIVKVDPDKDLYVEWSTIVDDIIQWGTAEELGLPADRKERADKNGTSMIDSDWFGWTDKEFMVMVTPPDGKGDCYMLPRKNLYDFIEYMTHLAKAEGTDNVSDEMELKALEKFANPHKWED